MDDRTNRGFTDATIGDAEIRLEDITKRSLISDHLRAQVQLESRLRAVAEVNQAILPRGPTDEVLRLIAHRVRHLVDAAVTMILLPETSGELTLRAVAGHNTQVLRELHLPTHGTLAGAVASSGEERLISDLSKEPLGEGDLVMSGLLGSVILVPLTVRAHVVGVIEVANCPEERRFDEEDLQTVRRFAGQVGLAVETHLSGGVALRDALSLERRNAQLHGQLQQLAPVAVETGDLLEQTLDKLAHTAVDLTDVVACSIQLLAPDLSLQSEGSAGLPKELLRGMERACELGAPNPALETIAADTAVVVTNEQDRIMADARYQPVQDLVRDAPWAAMGCLPLAGQTGNRGALCYYFRPEDRPGEADLGFLKVVAAQAAAVVDNAQLLAAARKKVELEERQHLARELHDSVSQALYGIALGARTTLEQLDRDPSRAREPVSYVLQLAEAGLAEMRALIFELLPDSLATEGLAAALVKQTDAVRAWHHIAVDTVIQGVPESAIEGQQALYRIAQEALNNAAKHAAAEHVELRLSADEESLTLDVTDDGTGFDTAEAFPGHLGLRSMRERAAALGGTCQISSRPGAGTHVRAKVPRFPGRQSVRG